MKQQVTPLVLTSLLLVLVGGVQAQPLQHDTTFVDRATQQAKKMYQSAVSLQSHLYNGSSYADYVPTEEEHPYYISNDWVAGSITYEGQHFDNASLMYNIHVDKIVVEHSTGAFIDLVPEKVASFTLSGHSFERFTKNNDSRGAIADGFYDIVQDGTVKFVVRRTKKYTETIQSSAIKREFDSKDFYYLVRNNTFYPVKSKGSVLQVLGDQKQSLTQFINKNKVKFPGDREYAIKRVVQYYNTLTP